MLFSAPKLERPSGWFSWHSGVIRPGSRVLDLACGTGRQAIAAAELGARVTAIDHDQALLRTGNRIAQQRRLSIEWMDADLRDLPIPEAAFDLVMIFNYLDRRRMTDFTRAVKPNGYLLIETFLDIQRQLGWGPRSDDHLLRAVELPTLVRPLETILYREALDLLDGRPRAAASILAQRIG